MAGASEQVVYHSLHPVEIVSDQVDAPLGSMSHAEQQVFGPRPFCKWWWQDGPVDNCCSCFPLRTGIMLLSFINLLDGVLMFFTDKIVALNIAQLKRAYGSMCSNGGNAEMCKMLSEKKAEADFIVSCEPLLYSIGIALVCFSLVGMRAACTGNPKFAKVFMMIYPFALVCNVVTMILRAVMAPSTFTPTVQVNFFVEVFFCAYYFKVTWSFYHRRKIMEDMQRATDASVQGHTINMPVTQTPTVV